jgi:O-antigen/teichoic acid export membrane protein
MIALTIKSSMHTLRCNKLLQAGFWLSGAGVVGGVLGYVFQVLMGRLLSPAEFALFSAIMALTVFFMSPLGALNMLVSRRVSILRALAQHHAMRHLYLRTHQALALSGLCFLALMAIALPHIQNYLKAPDTLPIWIFSMVILFGAMTILNNAFFQGQQQFTWLGASGVVGVSIKIIFSVILISLGWGISGAVLGVLLSIILMWLLGTAYTLKKLPSHGTAGPQAVEPFPISIVVPVLIANVAFAIMTQLDMVLVNHYFDAEQAGMYAAASVLGKAVLYLPGGLVMVMFPMVAEQHANDKGSAHLLMQAAGATLLVCGAAALFYGLLGPWLVQVFYGQQYAAAGKLLGLYGWAILPMAMVMVAEHFLIAKGRILFAWLFLAVAPLQLLIIHLWHPNLESVILVLGAGGIVMVVIGYSMLLRDYLRR